MKALVTGSTGFIGRHLVKALIERGHIVSTIDRVANISAVIDKAFAADILDREKIREAVSGHDVVLHLAAILGTSELVVRARDAVDVNISGTINVLDACRSENARLLFVSKPNPWLNTYSITKQAAEQFCRMYRDEFQVPVTIVKPFNVYGPGESAGPGRPQKMIPTTIMKALNNDPVTIFGTGEQVNDYIYIDDAVRMICDLVASKKAFNETFDIGTGSGQTVNTVCDAIVELTGSNSVVDHRPMRSGESSSSVLRADLTPFAAIFGATEFVALRDGLKKTVEYYQTRSVKD